MRRTPLLAAALALWAGPARGGGGAPAIAAPEGWAADEAPRPPVLAMFSKGVWGGELLLTVERHPKQDGEPSLEAFARQLGAPAAPRTREAGGKAFELFEDIPVESFRVQVAPQDPWAEELGSDLEPPRLSVIERRRFPAGGEAYRLYRCRKRGAWTLLRAYRKALAAGAAGEFRRERLDGRARALAAACFGKGPAAAMERGAPVEDVPKPSMYRLRLMARDEWTYGAERSLERESVWLADRPDAIWAVRYRAPERAYAARRGEYLRFLSALALPD